MNWSRNWLALILFLLLVSCGGDRQEARSTPTPFSDQGVSLRAPVGEPIAISLSNLAANPTLFEGANLQLRGAYKPLPRLICEQSPFPSPATWALQGEGLQANATGLDEQLRELVDLGQEITVEGRWLRYSGPVGCGKDAPEQEIWYLSTSRVIEPNPLARESAVVVVTIDMGPSPTSIPTETPIQEATETPTETVTPQQTATLGAPTDVPSPTYVPSPTIVQGGGTPQRTSPTPVPSPITGTPGGTGTPTLTPTATGTPGTATPTASATAAGGTVVEKGNAELEDLIINRLESGNIDSRTVSVTSSTALTVTVAPAQATNIIITVLDPNGQVIADGHDQAGAGEVETITDLDAPESGIYRIQVSSDSAEATDYAMMVMDSDSYSFEFMGTVDLGIQRGDSLAANNDHFWFFSANDGESINLTVTPTDDRDPYVELYGPDGTLLETIDGGGGGEAEELNDQSILATGMYSVRVGEFDFEPMSYLIIVERS